MVGAACREHEAEIARLGETVRRLSEENGDLRGERDALAAEVDGLESQLEAAKAALVEMAAEMRHHSERGRRDGAGAEDGEAEGSDAQPAGCSGHGGTRKKRRGQRRGARGHGRRSYEHLPTEEVVHEPSERSCTTCGTPYEAMGEERSEELDWVVALRRIIHRRPRYRRRCRCVGTKGIITAPPPPKAIAKGRFSCGFLARLVVAKYVVGLPCSRLISSLALEGASFSAGTLTGVMASLAPLLSPLAELIRARNAEAEVIHADETSWPVFVEVPDKPNHRWWLWVFISKDTVAYVMKPSRGSTVVAAHLGIDLDAEVPSLGAGRTLTLCSDFYSVYQSLGAKVEGIRSSWCWAHIRRRFVRAGAAHPDTCKEWSDRWIGRIGALFKAHKTFALARAGSAVEALARLDMDKALGEIDRTRLAEAADPGLPKAAAKVLVTLEREWAGLVVPVTTPSLELDNNAAEVRHEVARYEWTRRKEGRPVLSAT